MAPDIIAMPFVPMRGIVVYPRIQGHIDIGREKSLAAVDYAMEHGRTLIMAAQIDDMVEDPTFDDVYQTGVLVKIVQLLRPGGLVRLLIEGIDRVQIQGFSQKENYLEVAAVKDPDVITDEIEAEALRRVDLKRFGDWMKNIRNHDEIMEKATSLTEPSDVANFIASQLPVRLVVRQQVLELTDVNERLRKVAVLLDTEVDIANLE